MCYINVYIIIFFYFPFSRGLETMSKWRLFSFAKENVRKSWRIQACIFSWLRIYGMKINTTNCLDQDVYSMLFLSFQQLMRIANQRSQKDCVCCNSSDCILNRHSTASTPPLPLTFAWGGMVDIMRAIEIYRFLGFVGLFICLTALWSSFTLRPRRHFGLWSAVFV